MALNAVVDHGPVRPDMETWAAPRRMLADDGMEYAVKIRNGDGSKSFFNEFVVARIAKGFALPVLDTVPISVSANVIDGTPELRAAGAHPGPYPATLMYHDAFDLGGGRLKVGVEPPGVKNRGDIPGFIAFDVFVCNTDRNPGNTLVLPGGDGPGSGYRYVLIDHGHCFGGPYWDEGVASNLPYDLADVPWPTDGVTGEDVFVQPVDRMSAFKGSDLDDAKAAIPSEWDVSDTEYTTLKTAMSARSRDGIMNAIASGRDMFEGWGRGS